MTDRVKKLFSVIFEIVKWGIVLWLLWPLLSFQAERMSLWRVVLGVMLIVIYVGKMFYDFILGNFKRQKERYTVADLLLLVGAIAIIAIIIGGTILLVGFYVVTQLQEATSQP
ncbi:hypothetical protein EH223_20445 [candidate division KSB1 bacterium]|nr:hypothetical protein [candidate division KSB1 bacterium]RQV99873.1 MAG: hypothetical protein EH223_20445 [candidate division KSB1 bacterium]